MISFCGVIWCKESSYVKYQVINFSGVIAIGVNCQVISFCGMTGVKNHVISFCGVVDVKYHVIGFCGVNDGKNQVISLLSE